MSAQQNFPADQVMMNTILLVEDEVFIAMSEQAMLRRHGFTVLSAADGETAVEIALRAPQLDLILMDINLGRGIDGTEAAQQILAQRDLPIVFLSSHTEREVVEKTEKITSYGYVVKNSGETVLIASIKMAFKLFDAHQRLKQQDAALQRMNESLKLAQAASHAGTWDWDIQQNTFYWSEEFLRLFGMGAATMPGFDAWTKVMHPDDRECAAQNIRAAIAEHTDLINDYRIILPTQDTRWIRAIGKTFYDGATPRRMVGLCFDITTQKRTEEALREREFDLAEAQRVTRIGNWRFDIAANIIRWSDELYRIFDIEKAAFDGMYESFVSRVHPDDKRLVLETNRKAREYGESFHLEYRIVTPGNQEKLLREIGYALKDATGKVTGLFGTAQDITDLKRSEEALYKTEQQFRATLDNMLEGCQIIGFDWRYLYINDAAAIHNRRAKEALLGQRYMDMWPGIEALDVFRMIKRCLEERMPHQMENEFVFPDGTKGWFELSIQPVSAGVFILSMDITARKLAEEALHQSEQLFRLCLKNAPVTVAAQDVSLRFLWAYNQRTVDPRAVVGKMDADIFIPEDAERLIALKRQVLATNQDVHTEIWLTRNGQPMCLDLFIEPLRDPAGQVTGVGIATVDLTPLKLTAQALQESEQQLRVLNAQKDKFFSILAHDLRSPLIGFLSFATLLEEKLKKQLPPEQAELIKHFRTSAEMLFALLENLLTWARLQQGQMACFPTDFPLDQVAASVVNLLAPNAFAKRITLTNAVPPGDVHADISMTDAIIRNLIGNALKFAPPGGVVTITAVQSAHEVCVTVADTGIGIPPNMLARLFHPGERTQRSGTSGEKGTGLGLILCKEFVEKQGGAIRVESEPGQGTRVMFTLPTKPADNS